MLSARYLITATGFLSQPKMPDIAGITTFEGKVIHTTEWEDDFDPTGRRVGIIGTGATAVQLIPKLAEKAAELTVYQRTPIWVAPKIDLRFSDRVKKIFARLPWTQRLIRAITDTIYELMITVGVVRYRVPLFRRLNISAMDLCKINQFVAIRDKELRRKLTPDYDIGCKRPTFSNSYFRTFAKPHVHLQAEGIERVEADGIVNADGSKTHIDTLVLATGFDLWEANFPAIEVIGRDGRNLGKWWRDTRFQAYQGVSMPYFPNYLGLASPFAFLGLNFFNTMEYQMRLMERLFTELRRQGADTFEVTEEANARYLDRMTELLGDSLWKIGNCATLAFLLLQSQRRTVAVATDGNLDRNRGGVELSAERLRDQLTPRSDLRFESRRVSEEIEPPPVQMLEMIRPRSAVYSSSDSAPLTRRFSISCSRCDFVGRGQGAGLNALTF